MNKADIVNKACFNLFISIVDNTIREATNAVIDKAIFIKVLALVFLVNAFKASDTSPKTSEKSWVKGLKLKRRLDKNPTNFFTIAAIPIVKPVPRRPLTTSWILSPPLLIVSII